MNSPKQPHFRTNFFIEVWVDAQLRSIEGIPDPFAHIKIRLSWWDRIRVLLGRPFVVNMRAADGSVVDAVMGVLNVEPVHA